MPIININKQIKYLKNSYNYCQMAASKINLY